MKPITRSRGGLLTVIAVIPVMAILLSSTAGWADSLPDDPGKFNGLWWGQALGELRDMRLVGYDPTSVGEVYYVHQGDILQMGDAKLEYVRYGFWKGLYSSVLFGTRGVKNWEALRSICFENFESWHQPDWRVERYYWVGEHSAMTLEYDETLYQGQLMVYSKTIYERQLAQERRERGPRPMNRFRLY